MIIVCLIHIDPNCCLLLAASRTICCLHRTDHSIGRDPRHANPRLAWNSGWCRKRCSISWGRTSAALVPIIFDVLGACTRLFAVSAGRPRLGRWCGRFRESRNFVWGFLKSCWRLCLRGLSQVIWALPSTLQDYLYINKYDGLLRKPKSSWN